MDLVGSIIAKSPAPGIELVSLGVVAVCLVRRFESIWCSGIEELVSFGERWVEAGIWKARKSFFEDRC